MTGHQDADTVGGPVMAADADGQSRVSSYAVPPETAANVINIADRYANVLRPLTIRQRRGLIQRLVYGYFDGWQPSLAELKELLASELGAERQTPPKPTHPPTEERS